MLKLRGRRQSSGGAGSAEPTRDDPLDGFAELAHECLALPALRHFGIVAVAAAGPLFRRRASTHLPLVARTNTSATHELWLKTFLCSPGEAGRCYRYLRAVTPRFAGEPALGVPCAVGCLPRREALLMTRERGETLASRRRRGEATAQDWERAGRWLAHLHREARAGAPFEAERVVTAVLDLLGPLRRRGIIDERFCSSAATALRAVATRLSPAELLPVRTHGDFASFNVLVEARRVVALDFSFHGYLRETHGFCPAAEDIAHFVGSLAASSRARFLAGYDQHSGRAPVAAQASALRLFGARHALQAELEWQPMWRRVLAFAGQHWPQRHALYSWRHRWLDAPLE